MPRLLRLHLLGVSEAGLLEEQGTPFHIACVTALCIAMVLEYFADCRSLVVGELRVGS